MGKVHDGVEDTRPMGRQPQAGYPVLRGGIGFTGRSSGRLTRLARDWGRQQVKRTLISAAVGVGMACIVFFSVDAVDQLRRTAYVAELQAQHPSSWLAITDLAVSDGQNRNGVITEPRLTQTLWPQRLIEARVAVSNRNVQSGEPACVGGTVTFILEPGEPMVSTRPLSRIAGVDHCDWPVGEYRGRFAWTLTDPETRVTKTILQESGSFRVLP